MSETSVDPVVLSSAKAAIEGLIAEMREGLHNGAPIREQLPRIERLAEQYDLAGMHEAARGFRRQADALVPLRDLEDRRLSVRARRWSWRRVLTLGGSS